MIISCPNCDTKYNIPDDTLLPNGRKVRCSSCSHRWHVTPPPQNEDLRGEDNLGDKTISPMDDETAETSPVDGTRSNLKFHPPNNTVRNLPRTSIKALSGWIAILVVVALISTFVLARERVIAAFPATQPIYGLLGLSVEELMPLVLSDVASEEILDESRSVIVITGVITNSGDAGTEVPRLQISLLDSDRVALNSSMFEAESGSLEQGASTVFEARFPDPPEAAKHFSVTFEAQQPTD